MNPKHLAIAVVFVFSCVLPVTATVLAVNDTYQLTNPLGGSSANKKGITDVNEIVGKVIQAVLGILGSIALVVFMYGGFLWLTSAGSEEKVSAGLSAMLYAAVGIFVIFGSYAILNTVLSGLRN